MFDCQKEPDFDESPKGESQFRAWHEALTAELIQVAGHINAMEYYFIKLLSRYDQHECWAGEGVKSFAHWLNWKCGINALVAREKIRVARCLRVLPLIDDAFGAGRISYSKARALTRAATPENEALLLEAALDLTTEHVEQLVRRYKKAPVPGEYVSNLPQEQQPYVVCHQDEDGMMQLHARLPVEDGLLVDKAIEKMTNRMRQDNSLSGSLAGTQTQESGLQAKKVSAETSRGECGWYRFGRERARALVQIAEHYLGDSDDDEPDDDKPKALSGADKYHIVVHVNVNDAHRDCRINKGLVPTSRTASSLPRTSRRCSQRQEPDHPVSLMPRAA